MVEQQSHTGDYSPMCHYPVGNTPKERKARGKQDKNIRHTNQIRIPAFWANLSNIRILLKTFIRHPKERAYYYSPSKNQENSKKGGFYKGKKSYRIQIFSVTIQRLLISL